MINRNSMLERRILKLERAFGRHGVHSNAYFIWQFLMKNGPSTSKQIKDYFPSNKRDSIAYMIVDCVKMDCIFKNGNMFTANPDYDWDDVGVIKDVEDERPKSAGEPETAGDLGIDGCDKLMQENFDNLNVSNYAEMELVKKTNDKLVYHVKYDDGYIMRLNAKLELDGTLRITMPYIIYDLHNTIVDDFEYKNKSMFEAALKKLKTANMVISLLGVVLEKATEYFETEEDE